MHAPVNYFYSGGLLGSPPVLYFLSRWWVVALLATIALCHPGGKASTVAVQFLGFQSLNKRLVNTFAAKVKFSNVPAKFKFWIVPAKFK